MVGEQETRALLPPFDEVRGRRQEAEVQEVADSEPRRAAKEEGAVL